MSVFSRAGAPTTSLSRRRFLALAGMTAAAVPILSACGSPSGASAGGFSQPDVAPPAPFKVAPM